MKSLRSRLILAFSLVATVPLLLAIALLGGEMRRRVEADARSRLDDALAAAESRLLADYDRLALRVQRLAQDSRLRAHLLAGDSVAARARLEEMAGGMDVVLDPAEPGLRRSPVLATLPGGRALAMSASEPVRDAGRTLAVVRSHLTLDSLALANLAPTSAVDLVLTEPGGAAISTLLGAAGVAAGGRTGRVSFDDRSYLVARRGIGEGTPPQAWLTGFVSTAAADQALETLWIAAGLLALLGIAVAVALGTAWSRQVSRPVERLASFSERIARGEWEEPLRMESARELETLVEALERMRADLRGYRERLAAGERQAAYGRMARAVAHEIKNPLTPIAVSVSDLQRSFQQGRPEFPQILDQAVRTIGEEVQSLQRMIREFAEFGRLPAPVMERMDAAAALAEVAALLAADVESGRLVVMPSPEPLPIEADRGQIRRALLNLVQNGLDATAPRGRVTVRARRAGDTAELEVADDGPGLPPERVASLFEPGFTTKPHGSGLGLTIVERIASDHGGTVSAASEPGRGTTFVLRLPISRRT